VLPSHESALTEGEEVGHALSNYSTSEVKRIKGRRSSQISALLGYADSEYVAVRENIALHAEMSRPATPTLGSHGTAMTLPDRRSSVSRPIVG